MTLLLLPTTQFLPAWLVGNDRLVTAIAATSVVLRRLAVDDALAALAVGGDMAVSVAARDTRTTALTIEDVPHG